MFFFLVENFIENYMYKCVNNNFSFVVMVSIIKIFDKFMYICLKGICFIIDDVNLYMYN